ncbi:unnamed protein product [Rotaria socialis]|uniref:Fringe-like glycosyltransferase domain-containing protein n=1 Tax=Rotaria socialis TaxID=392032 RepID=A0A817RRJ8_9BILA|nr:unnamed protein product [Rotaria socialis]CAF3327767.1 unnamed protein product [Rotaria socialis]CAF3332025.1 unnamed protein product [Rotaria socialis]CAF3363652.1 unnamed protein product [Rotaria socialis]CAF3682326.1 unnamed protein product [Rotaria socialis]
MCRRRNRVLLRCTPITILLTIITFSFIVTSLITRHRSNFTPNIVDQTIILVRTSYHCQSRLIYLLQSWIPSSLSEQSNIYLLTDSVPKYSGQTILNSFKNVIETNCPETHNRFDLCCKTAHEFELFYNLSQTKPTLEWMCRFDDDQYVNLNNLYKFLSKIDSSEPHYIGRTSIDYRLRTAKENRTYTFATYGAGVCFSVALLEKLRPHVNKTILPHNCIKRGISDDAYIGYLTEFILNISLISLRELFHSHLEKLDKSYHSFSIINLKNSITLGFSWDRYKLSWLPIIHQLVQLMNKQETYAANILWIFLQNYEKEHPEDLNNKHDESCTSYIKKLQQSNNFNIKSNKTI